LKVMMRIVVGIPTMATQLYFDCDESIVGVPKMMITIPKRVIQLRKPYHYIPLPTFGETVDAAVREWYAALGQPVPPEELVGAAIDLAQEGLAAADEKALERDKETGAGPKPEFGTPEFWAWARKRRAEENAKRAAEGLPPLPTAKEKAAAKEAKAAAKAAKGVSKK
jgi:hypothetical protein